MGRQTWGTDVPESETQRFHEELSRLEEENRFLGNELMSLRHFVRSLQDLADASRRRAGPEDTMALLRQILKSSLDAINAEDGSLMILDEDTGDLVFVLAMGRVPQEQIFGFRVPRGRGIAGWVVENQEPTIVDDVRKDDRFFSSVDDHFGFETHTVLCSPIVGGGRVLGVVEILNKVKGHTFTVDDLTLVTLLCRFAGELLHSMEERVATERGGA